MPKTSAGILLLILYKVSLARKDATGFPPEK